MANLGIPQALFYLFQHVRARLSTQPRHLRLYSRQLDSPVVFRAGTSDVNVFNQIFLRREYSCLDGVATAGLIIDCGANVGYSSAYFLSRFPGAQLVAVEPDPGNFAMLEANLAAYKGRWRALCSAVWSHPAGLVFTETAFGDGREWARAVREARPEEKPALLATDIGTLLEESGFERISILKIDIEGSEAAVFSSGFEQWIGRVDNLVIEIHGEECEEIFLAAISREPFVLSRCEELHVCRRVVGRP